MNEALGNAMLTKIIIFIIIVVMFLFIGALSYSKAYKAKNNSINAIEKNSGYETAISDINESLFTMGYSSAKNDCNLIDGFDMVSNQNYGENNNFDYCVYKKCLGNKIKNTNRCDDKGEYYKVVTYMEINLPLIHEALKGKVTGETKILNKNYNY